MCRIEEMQWSHLDTLVQSGDGSSTWGIATSCLGEPNAKTWKCEYHENYHSHSAINIRKEEN